MRLSRIEPTAVIRGIGAFTPAGSGRQAVIGDGAMTAETLPTACSAIRVARVELAGTDELLPSLKLKRILSRGAHLALVSAVAAVCDAQADLSQIDSDRLGVFATGIWDTHELTHLHSLLLQLRQQGLAWRDEFGSVAVRRLPAFMLLKRLPNAGFSHVAKFAQAKGYNATLANGPISGLDCLRRASAAIVAGRLDAALVVCCDSPITWQAVSIFDAIAATAPTRDPLVMGESGISFYLEREGLRRGAEPGYARFLRGASRQASTGIVKFRKTPPEPPQSLDAALCRALMACGKDIDLGHLRLMNTADVGIQWWDSAERAAQAFMPAAELQSCGSWTGYLGNACGAAGLAQTCYELRATGDGWLAAVARVAPTGLCGAVILQGIDTAHPV